MKIIRKISCFIIAAILMVISAFTVFSETIYGYYGLQYMIVNDREVSVVGWDNRSPNFEIPAAINGRKITSVNNGALNGNTVITSVDFSNADNLSIIGAYAFQDCTGINEQLVLPESVTEIQNRAFQGCSSLPSVIINSAVSEIPTQCFNNCSSLSRVELPEGIEKINAWAFANCSSLEYVNIPESVNFISDYAFYNSTNVLLGVYNDSYAHNYAVNNRIDHMLLDKFESGDVNGDGVIDILDSTEIQKYAAEMTEFTDEQFELGDINKDGFVDVIDALLVQKSVVGKYDIPPIIIRY